MRGEGSNEDMYRIAEALCRHRSLMGSPRNADHNRRVAAANEQSELTAPSAASAR
jgi:hypothetical protein